MTVGEQLSLFDLSDPEPEQVREWSPPEIDGACEHCGAPVSSRSPVDRVNHGRFGDTCVTRQLSRMHALNAQRRLDPGQRREDERCMRHQGIRHACSQLCWQQEYENYAARATTVWNGDGWKEYP